MLRHRAYPNFTDRYETGIHIKVRLTPSPPYSSKVAIDWAISRKAGLSGSLGVSKETDCLTISCILRQKTACAPRAGRGEAMSTNKVSILQIGSFSTLAFKARRPMLITYNHTDQYSYIYAVLSVISSLAQPKRKLQPQQVELLSRLLVLPERYRAFPFSLQAKKHLISTHYPGTTLRKLNTRLLNLKAKGYLVTKEDGELYINDFLIKILKQYPKFSLNVQFNKKEDS